MNEPSGDALRPAGFWIRAVAALLDVTVIVLVQFVLGLAAGWVWGPAIEDAPAFQAMVPTFTLAFSALYTTVLHSLTGQTVGKMLVGVRVVSTGGALLPAGAALLRYIAYYVSLVTLGLGFAMAGLRADKRALHDLLAGSRVERDASHRREPVGHLAPDELAPPGVG